ncbi:MAG: multicopper oxidase domain-containing protein [Gammaproteobacteria bacterium]|nr:multicopper oxidase domain-containing protein [Gammaproteobacteria bacterium]
MNMKLFSRLLLSIVLVFGASLSVNAMGGGGGSTIGASLSTDTVNVDVDQTGSWTISGNDGGGLREFRWSLPSGLSVSTGASSNMARFRVRSDRGYLQVQTAGGGSFTATVNVSSGSSGSYLMQNLRADLSLSPRDVTVNVASGGTSGGTSGGGSMDGGGGGMDGGGGGMGGGGAAGAIPVFDAQNVTLMVRTINRTMSDGATVPFWVFCEGGMGGGGGGGCSLPSPVLELQPGQTANVTLNMMMAPQEAAPYHGHTIHPHGLDVPMSEDGVPETGAGVNGDTYTFSVDNRYIGSHAYHCHVHTVKHLEMGMYGAFIVKSGNQINDGGPTYDVEWNIVLSTVDPAYHTATGDSTVFADYNPRYFLMNGNEGLSRGAPAEVITAAPGNRVAIRLIGMHSVNSTFEIRDANGSRLNFTQHNFDGFALPSPRNVSSVEISPGQTTDIMITLPGGSGSIYPEVSYRDLRNNNVYNNGRVYSRIDY